ncbi:hypothetical protein AVEN_155476-1 [Araneus ventricosus]|uniref:Uncharacterized protein n=1 Tax=Araneus ventricosus TaxID=182803 RepID=A0A4Y2URT7_ARAVE|nr:hypothetical protein AVEN_155476-1 [Araneus ventricosus]
MPETGPLTRSMDKQFEKLFAMMAGLEQKMEAGQERLEQEMRSGQERMEGGRDKMKGMIEENQTENKKTEESLQELAADVERLMSLPYSECPLDVRESLAAQYFVDVIREEDT